MYKALSLNLPRRKKRSLPQRVLQPMLVKYEVNAEWSLGFMIDTFYQTSRRFCTLNILDEGVREVLEIVIDTSIIAQRVVRALERLVECAVNRERYEWTTVLNTLLRPSGTGAMTTALSFDLSNLVSPTKTC